MQPVLDMFKLQAEIMEMSIKFKNYLASDLGPYIYADRMRT